MKKRYTSKDNKSHAADYVLRGGKKGYGLSADVLLDLVKQSQSPLKSEQIGAFLGLDKKSRRKLQPLLAELLESGELLYLAGGRYVTPGQLKRVSGQLQVQRSGIGFVVSKDAVLKGQDIYISPEHFGAAWHGDKVVVGLLPDRRGKSPEGIILDIQKRKLEHILVRVVRQSMPGEVLCAPLDSRQTGAVLADVSGLSHLPLKGDVLSVAPLEHLEKGLWRAKVIDNMGNGENVPAQERITKLSHAIPGIFSDKVLAEAASLPVAPGEEDFAGRTDLRHLDFVTIDGERAKDFDDAIYVEKSKRGYTLYVSIADVTHYVHPGSALDKEALLRGNSYYFAQSVEPMLPEALSNGLCSLQPGEPRLTVTAEMYFSLSGDISEVPRFYFSIINSRARLIYDAVSRALDDDNAIDRALLEPVLPMLENAHKLAKLLQQRRIEDGTLFIDRPETEPQFDADGRVLNIKIASHNFAHQMIEEFMIAANEAVARFLKQHKGVFPYRVHPYPDQDKLNALFRTLARSDLAKVSPHAGAEVLPGILNEVRGKEQEYVVSSLVLRAMMQAKYDSEPEGHFGLASDLYCHFTSPIRRYADVLVHRALRRALGCPYAGKISRAGLDKAIDDINACEKTAKEAELELNKRIAVLYMLNKVGEDFLGVISGVTEFGIFVELKANMVEGMIRLQSLNDHFIYFPERQELLGEHTKQRFRLGQEVQVKLVEVHLHNLEITFELIHSR